MRGAEKLLENIAVQARQEMDVSGFKISSASSHNANGYFCDGGKGLLLWLPNRVTRV
jgi:hypothetical protein